MVRMVAVCCLLLAACGGGVDDTRRVLDAANSAVLIADRSISGARDKAVADAKDTATTVEELRAALTPWIDLSDRMLRVLDVTLEAYALIDAGMVEAAANLLPCVLAELEALLVAVEGVGVRVPDSAQAGLAVVRSLVDTELRCPL